MYVSCDWVTCNSILCTSKLSFGLEATLAERLLWVFVTGYRLLYSCITVTLPWGLAVCIIFSFLFLKLLVISVKLKHIMSWYLHVVTLRVFLPAFLCRSSVILFSWCRHLEQLSNYVIIVMIVSQNHVVTGFYLWSYFIDIKWYYFWPIHKVA